jgi:hypothetical protein
MVIARMQKPCQLLFFVGTGLAYAKTMPTNIFYLLARFLQGVQKLCQLVRMKLVQFSCQSIVPFLKIFVKLYM